jgi:hypothetical protein
MGLRPCRQAYEKTEPISIPYPVEPIKYTDMKKTSFAYFILFLLTGFAATAQLSPPGSTIQKSKPVKVQRSAGLESEPTRTTTLPITNADYLLSSAKVIIRTGSDNKESLSNIRFELAVRDTNYRIFAQNNCTNELKVNSENTFGLESAQNWIKTAISNAIPIIYLSYPTGTNAVKLSDVEKFGLSLRILYKPNFFADAWKIENVSLQLEFRDAKGNLHPTAGQKTIVFTNTSTFLDCFDKRILICTADNRFNPLTSFVTKDFTKRW